MLPTSGVNDTSNTTAPVPTGSSTTLFWVVTGQVQESLAPQADFNLGDKYFFFTDVVCGTPIF